MWSFNSTSTSHASLSPRGLRRLPPNDRASRALPLLAIKIEPPEHPTPTMEDVLDPDLAVRALGQFLDSPEPHDLYETPHELYEIVSCKLVDAAAMSSSSPLSVSDVPMPSLSPMGDSGEFLSEWLDHRSDSEGELDSDGYDAEEFSPSPVPAIETKTEMKDDPSEQKLLSHGETDQKIKGEDKGDKERLRQRQRLYEKKYRNRKKIELKHLRKEWMELEMELLMARRERLAENVVASRQHTLHALKSRTPVHDRAELLRRCRLLARVERALLLDRMALSAFGGFDRVARIREYTDKEKLCTRREWQHSTNKIFGQNANLTPHRVLPLSFMW